MGFFQQPIFFALLMFVAGLGIPVMAALNGGLGSKLGSPALATAILFAVGGLISLGYLYLTDGMSKINFRQPIPIFFYFGGVFVMFYILSMTWIAPKFGVANSVSLVLLGQLISMVVIDQYGLLGAQQHSISTQRIAGLIFMALGVFLVVRRI